MTKTLLALIAPVALAAGPGCVFVDRDDGPEPDPIGDISFLWSFDGERDCDFAGVDELDIVIFRDGQLFQEIEAEPCVGGGLVFLDFFNDRYEVEMDAYSRDNILLYSGGFSIRVVGGIENDAGIIEFQRINGEPPPPPPPPPPETGSLGFFWTFLYPSQSAIESCDIAGVETIDVALTDEDGGVLRESYVCADIAGASFDNLPEGDWTLDVDAYGRYRNGDIHLYGLTVAAPIRAGRSLELDALALARDEDSFADIEAVWDFAGTSCATEGIEQLTLAVQRDGLDTAEDVTTVNCTSLSATRRTFVPGAYTISLTGVGDDTTFGAIVDDIDVGPDTTTSVTLHLSPE